MSAGIGGKEKRGERRPRPLVLRKRTDSVAAAMRQGAVGEALVYCVVSVKLVVLPSPKNTLSARFIPA